MRGSGVAASDHLIPVFVLWKVCCVNGVSPSLIEESIELHHCSGVSFLLMLIFRDRIYRYNQGSEKIQTGALCFLEMKLSSSSWDCHYQFNVYIYSINVFSFFSALHEFPTDVFSQKDRRGGAVALHVFCAMYMFYALAIVCDDYFVPSLDKICERLHLSQDVAGATFMAAGSSAPELFTSVIGVFITKGDVGVGTIVGSAVFNVLCIIGVCGLFAGQAVPLSCWTLIRDSVYYTLSVVALIVVAVFHFLLMIFTFTSNNAEIDDSSNCEATMVLLKKANFHRKPSVLMVDELLSAYPHQLTFSEAGLRIMITSHFPPRTRLTMASRMLITERQRLIHNRSFTNGDSEVAVRIPSKHGLENGLGMAGSSERGMNNRHGDNVGIEAGNETENENEDNENNENDEEEEEEDDNEGPLLPFEIPAGKCNKLKWIIAWPLSLLLFFTVPNCASPRWEKWFMVTFASSTMWIACFSYVMVWMVTIIGFTLGIPDVIMGITFLAAGTSVPDCMASLIVARQGLGDMAVSNSIGSNVFDILVGLGLPWALQTLAIDYGSYVNVPLVKQPVVLSAISLDRKLGLMCLSLYAVFLCFSILIEFNVFTFVNLPMCQER
uniref:Solute carrier family 24 member 3 n=1 Tax=Erpetoichthys calabaricus TaxID=27687 RepID=A0A8C4T465_ERPCA